MNFPSVLGPDTFHRLSLAYGWTPTEIGQLTLPQLAYYAPAPATFSLPIAEARRWRREQLAAKTLWIDAQLAELNGTPA